MMTPDELSAIRKRDEAIPDENTHSWTDLLTRHHMPAEQAIMDRRALLAEVDRLRRWQAEALPVSEGLQELGQAFGLRLGDSITGTVALEAVNRLKAENARLRSAVMAERPTEAQTLRNAADAVPVDLWCTFGMANREHVEGFQGWLRERADRMEKDGTP